MRLPDSAAYAYCRTGRYGAQIPTLRLGFGPEPAGDPESEYPDDWFVWKSCAGLPTTAGRGFLFWSRMGLRQNRARLRREFKAAPGSDSSLTFQEWLDRCEADNAKIDAATEKATRSLSKKLATLQAYKNE